MKRRLFVCFLALTMLLSLTACGAASKTAASVDSSANDHPAESPAVTEEKGYFDADTNGYDDEGRDSGGGVLENQKIIYTGDINLETTEFDEAVKALAALAEVKGGYLESSTVGGCAVREGSADDGRLRVVTTLFPYYDFARAVAGDRADVTLLLAPGREAHSFEPTPLDAVTISRADVFIYNGGEGEVWVDDMLDAVGEDIGTVLRMMDFVDAREEEFSEGMQGADSHDHAHDHDHDHDEPDAHDHELHDHAEHDHDDSDEVEYDEHIWTSPKNAIRLCRAVADALCAADAENADLYRANCEDYCAQLEALDADLRALRANAVRDLLIFADRFPFLYFCEEYDLHYRAAFHGCSGDTEPSLATLKYLIDKVNDEHIPVVYTIDLSSQKVAEAVSECTGARIERLWSMQTISRTDFDAGETYLTLMQRNYEALKGGLL